MAAVLARNGCNECREACGMYLGLHRLGSYIHTSIGNTRCNVHGTDRRLYEHSSLGTKGHG